jgi:hypothetical protein
MYNDRGIKDVLSIEKYRWSHGGKCVAGEQGHTTRVMMCLIGSSKCGNNRMGPVWDDQIEWYMEEYPGSFVCRDPNEKTSTCDECVQEEDTCTQDNSKPKEELSYLESRRRSRQ